MLHSKGTIIKFGVALKVGSAGSRHDCMSSKQTRLTRSASVAIVNRIRGLWKYSDST